MSVSEDLLAEVRRLRSEGKHVSAELMLRGPATTPGAERAILGEYAAAAMDRCDWPEAARRCLRVLEQSTDEDAFVSASRAHRHLRDFAKAAEVAEAGLREFPGSGSLIVERHKALARDNGLSPYPPFEGKVARTYLEVRAHKESWHIEAGMIARKLDEIAANTVLDVPFGTGRFVPDYLARGMSVTGVDVSHDMMRSAREALGAVLDDCRLIRASVASLPFQDRSFELVVCLRLLPTNVDYRTARRGLAEMARVARSDVLVDLKCRSGTADPVLPPEDDEKMDARFSVAGLTEQLAALGLSVISALVMWRERLIEYRLFHLRPSDLASPHRETEQMGEAEHPDDARQAGRSLGWHAD